MSESRILNPESLTDRICTFELAGLSMGIRVNEVHEVLASQTLTPVPLSHSVLGGLINMRGQIVSAIDLRSVLRLPSRQSDDAPPVIVIVRDGQQLLGFLVDHVGDVLELESRLLAPPPETTPQETRHLFRGSYPLPQHLLLILDTSRAIDFIVSQASSRHLRKVT